MIVSLHGKYNLPDDTEIAASGKPRILYGDEYCKIDNSWERISFQKIFFYPAEISNTCVFIHCTLTKWELESTALKVGLTEN